MSAESQEIFHAALFGDADPETLRAAAVGHLGASRSLQELTELYARFMANNDHDAAQQIADELAPVRTATRVVGGGTSPAGG